MNRWTRPRPLRIQMVSSLLFIIIGSWQTWQYVRTNREAEKREREIKQMKKKHIIFENSSSYIWTMWTLLTKYDYWHLMLRIDLFISIGEIGGGLLCNFLGISAAFRILFLIIIYSISFTDGPFTCSCPIQIHMNGGMEWGGEAGQRRRRL